MEERPKKDPDEIQEDLSNLKKLPGLFEKLGEAFESIFGDDDDHKKGSDHE